jgi:hypothetical protein
VLHIVPSFGAGGAERVAANLLRTSDREQFDVGAITNTADTGHWIKRYDHRSL